MADMTPDSFIEAIGSRLKPINDAIRLKNRQKDLYVLDTMDDAVNLIELGVPDGAWLQTVHFVDEEGNTLLDDAVLTVDERFTEAVFEAPDIEGAEELTPNPLRLIFKLQGEDAEHTIVYEAWAYTTVLDISLTDSSNLSPNVRCQLNGTVYVDWGDGSEVESMTAENTFASNDSGTYLNHTYASTGDYTIAITCLEKDTYYRPRTSSTAANLCTFGGSAYKTICTFASFGKNVNGIAAAAFRYQSNLEIESLPNTVTVIEQYAFAECTKLALAELPNSLIDIGNYAFDGCTNLALTELPDGLTSLGAYAFRNCTNLALSELPQGLTVISGYSFQNCSNITFAELPLGVTSIEASAFSGCSNVTFAKLPDTLTSIASNAFASCIRIKDLTLPVGVTAIKGIIGGCVGLEGFTALGASTVDNYVCSSSGITSLKKVQLGSPGYPVSTMGAYSFTKCTGIEEMVIYTSDGEALSNAPFGATNATITYIKAL